MLAFTQTSDVVGMEFTQATAGGGYCGQQAGCMSGDLYYLVQGDAGLVRGQGFAYQAEYELTGEGTALELDLSPAPNAGWSTSILYSATPRELDITSHGYNGGVTMISIP